MRAVRGVVVALAVASVLYGCAMEERAASRQPDKPPTSSSVEDSPAVPQPPPIEHDSRRNDAPAASAIVLDRVREQKAEERAAGAAVTSATTVRPEAQQFAKAIAPMPYVAQLPVDTERYQHSTDNPVHLVAEQPVSTFSIDVDTGAYANVRRFLNAGQLPPQDAVRVEEMLNYFDYDYATPKSREQPFAVSTELAPAPWNANAQLLRVAIKAYELPASERPPANLVFLIDVSGSMQSPDKLPLLKNAFRLLTEQLGSRDRVSMVVYAGSSGVVLEPTAGDQKYKIREAIERLEAGGSTNGGEGIERAYQLARGNLRKDGINRVILATDGDFNVGRVDFEGLVDMAERERKSGVALTTLGFGTGNYNDQLLERLADAGNGNYAYVDTLSEARKVLVTELSSTLVTVAKDVKIQIEFNPAAVREYRLIGYENRMLAREDFNNDQVDAGEIGAGHRVTALYEIVPADKTGRIEPLRYASAPIEKSNKEELAWLRLRYKQPTAEQSQLIERPIRSRELLAEKDVSADFKFAASVAGFGQWLRGGKYLSDFDCDDVLGLARAGLANDREGYRREFVSLVELARTLQASANTKGAEEGMVAGR
ncbi:MAG: VWA domain-containing protein [Steroidobacteraceae bacterium]